MVLLALSWWVEAVDGSVDDAGLHDALDDVTWVVKRMADMPEMPDRVQVGKRAQEGEPDTSTKKR
jgi:hypothetical protein